MRDLLRRVRQLRRPGQHGYTFVEVIASVVILGIIMVPLGTAMVVGYRTVFGIQERLANTADVQKLSTYFPSDVASVDADGVNPTRLEDEGICKASPTEQSLITFRWDKDLGDNGQTVVRYLGRGAGINSEVVRRICRAGEPPVETVLASHFGEAGATEAYSYLQTDAAVPVQTPVCGPRQCFIDIHGAYDFHLDAQRRVEGDDGSSRTPGAPTNVHALGGFNRARLFWTDPADTGGLPITGYYIEANPGGIVGGATPTFYTPGSGTTGALIPGLTNNSSYYFRVRAVTVVGNGPWSEPSNTVTPGPTSPEPPTLDTAAGDPATNGRITAAWSLTPDYSDGGSALIGFNLVALNPDAIATTVNIPNPGTFSGAVTGLENNTKYKVQVTALNSYGEGSPSPVPLNVLTRPGAPGTPTVGPTGVAGSVVLNFTLPTGGDVADLTNVRAHVGSTFSAPVDLATACPDQQSCSLTVTGVNVSSSTNVTVQAQNATGWGDESSPVVIPADATPPTVAITFPTNPQYGTGGWNAGCNAAGGAICGTAADDVPGAVASVTLTVRRSGDNRYWNGNPGTGTSQWSNSVQNLTATGTTDWSRALTTASLENGKTYTITAVAKDTVNLSSTTVTRTFAYVTGAPTASLTAPASNARLQGTVTVSGTAAATNPATVATAEFQYKQSAGSTWTTIDTDLTSPYSVSWDTTALGDGSYDLRLFVTDSALNTGTSSTRTVVIDNTPPTGSIMAPANGSYVHGSSVAVTSDSADAGSGVANATFQFKPTAGVTWTQIGAADASSPYSVTWNSTLTPEGSYDLRVITTDNVGFQFSSPVIMVTVDNTDPVVGPPTVVGTAGNNGWYTSDVAVTWPAPTDAGSGIASTTGCGPTNITANTSGQVVTCSATDNAGNTASQSVTIKVDKTDPTGNLTAPPDGSAVAGTIPVSSNSADSGSGVANATFQWSPAGAGLWTTIGAPDTTPGYSVNWNTSALAQGNYDLRVITTDNAGNTFTSPIRTVFVDSTPPTVTITFPDDNGAYNATTWNAGCPTNQMCGTAADTAPGTVADVSVTIRRSSDNRYWEGTTGTGNSDWNTNVQTLSVNGTTSWNRVFTTGSLSNGVTYTVTVVATDSVGLDSVPATAVFKYDTTNPTGSITDPSNNDAISGTVPVTSNSTDSFSGVASAVYEYRVNTSGAWTTIGTDLAGPPWSVDWDTTSVPDGQYYLRVTTTDNAGNSVSSGDTSVRIRVDNVAPTGELTAPPDNSYVRGNSVTVSSNSADAGSGVANTTFQRSPSGTNTWTTIGTDGSSPYSVTWNTTTLSDGDYDLRVITTDNSGKSFTSATRTVHVDNTAPSVTPGIAGTLGDNGWYTSNVAVTWTVSDSAGIASSTGCGTTNVTSNTTGQVVTCSATDNAGNTTSVPVTIKRDATAPTGSLTAPNGGATIAGTIPVSSSSADATSGVANATFQYSPAGANTWTTIGAPDTTPGYSVNWNTSALSQGNYDVQIVTTDNAGNPFTSPIRTVFVDSTPPTVTITFPADNSAYNSNGWNAGCPTNQMCGTASDTAPGTVADVNITIRRSSDNRYWNGSTGTGTGQWSNSVQTLSANGTTAWNRVFTTGSLSNGVTYTVTAVATDAAGLDSTPATAVFTYDTSNPGGSITAPADNANVSATVTVSSSSSDSGSGVASAAFEYRTSSSGPWTAIGTDVAGPPWSVDWDTTGVANGLYDLRVTTTDNAGNAVTSSSTAVTVRVDNTPPTGTLTAPNDGAFVRTTVAVSSNSADTGGSGLANATFQRSPAGANTWTTIGTDNSSPYSVSWNTTSGTPDGSYDLRVISTDNSGNSFTSPTRTVTVDNTPPSVLGDATGTVGDNGWYVTSVSLTWNITETGSGIASQVGCANQNVTSDTTGNTYTCTVADNAGNSTNGSVTIKRDATNPTGSLTAPNAGATVSGSSVSVTSSSTDTVSGVQTADFQISPAGANSWTTIDTDGSSPYATTWNTTSGAEGNYDLRVVTTDKAGNTFTSPIRTVEVDNKPRPTDVTLHNGPGNTNGRAEEDDFVTITYSEPLKVSTICTGWSGDASDQNRTVDVRLNNSGSSDTVTVQSPCTNIGTIDTNRAYTSNTRTFANSTVHWDVSSLTLTITLGNPSGSVSSNQSATAPTYTPTASITDVGGNTMTTTAFTGTSSRF